MSSLFKAYRNYFGRNDVYLPLKIPSVSFGKSTIHRPRLPGKHFFEMDEDTFWQLQHPIHHYSST